MEFTARYGECNKSLGRFVASRFYSSVKDEIVSEAWYQAWLNYRSFRGGAGSFRSWLFSIAVHVGLNILRRDRRYRQKLIHSATLPGYSIGDAAVVSIKSHEDRVIAEIDVMSVFRGANADDILVARMPYEGFTSGELGRMLGISANAINQRRFRVIRDARRRI